MKFREGAWGAGWRLGPLSVLAVIGITFHTSSCSMERGKLSRSVYCRAKAMLAQSLLHMSEADKEEAMLLNSFSNFDLRSWLQESDDSIGPTRVCTSHRPCQMKMTFFVVGYLLKPLDVGLCYVPIWQ